MRFEEMSERERNEAIALALGWTVKPFDCIGTFGASIGQLVPPHEQYAHGNPLPDWQGDDGLAFKELWDRICELDHSATLDHSMDLAIKAVDACDLPNCRVEANTWAHVICKAFLALRGY